MEQDAACLIKIAYFEPKRNLDSRTLFTRNQSNACLRNQTVSRHLQIRNQDLDSYFVRNT